MKKKSFEAMGGQHQLSRTQMKSVTAGLRIQDPACDCQCNSGSPYMQDGSCVCPGGYAIPCSVGTGDQ
jgi:hypothetical protein